MATGPIETSSDVNLLYVNTNLKTSIIVRTSLTDTVSHIKERVLVDHMTTNSWIGEIKIRALQVKHSGKFYTMPDSLTVGEVFNGLKGNWNWCLRAICSQISKRDEMQISYGEGLKTDAMEDRFLSSSDISSRKKDGTSSYKVDADLRSNGFSTEDTGKKRKRSVKKNSGAGKKSQNDGSKLEGVFVEESNEKAGSIDNNGTLQNVESDSKRSKRSKKAVKIQNLSNLELETRRGKIIQEQYMAGEADRSDALESNKRNKDNALENAMADTFMAGKSEIGFFQNDQANHSESPSAKELNHGDPIENANAHGRKKRNKNRKGETAEKTLVSATEEKMVGNSQNILASVVLTDDTVLNSGILTEKSEGITAKDSNLSATAGDTSDTMQEVKSEGKKRKKSKKKDAEIQDMLHLEHGIRQGESSEPFVEAVNTVEKEDEGRLSLNHDDKVMLLSQSKTPDCIEKELTKKPTSGLPDQSEASIVPDHKIADGTEKRKKKRDKKSAGINLEKPALEQANNGANVSSVLLNFDISEEVQIKQYDDGTKKKNIGNENQSFDTLNENFAVLANGNEIVESNQAEENSEEGKKSEKRTKKSRASASDAQKNFPFKDQKISAEVSPVTEGSFSITGEKITYSEANVKLTSGNESKTNIVISQTEQTLEDDDTRKKNMGMIHRFQFWGRKTRFWSLIRQIKVRKMKVQRTKNLKRKEIRVKSPKQMSKTSFRSRVSNITSSKANEKHPTGNENEANIVISQTEQTLENDVPNKKNVGNDADFPVLEKENEILESVQADKINKHKGVTGRKSEKKRKKSRVSESDVQDNSPIKGANEKLSIGNENESNIVISQTEQTLDDDGTKKKNMVSDASFPVLGKENEILESNQAYKSKKDEGVEDKKSKKKRNKSQLTETDVQGKFSIRGSSITSSEANEKLPTGIENEANIMISQTEQTLEYDGTDKENMGNDAVFPVLEKENEIVESVQADKINKDECVTGRKSEKKKKKTRVSESDVQDNSPIKGANVKLPIGNENESNIVISQTEQTLDDDGTKKKNMVSDADCLVSVKGNEILESNLADKNNEGRSDEDKKSKKKRKNSQVTVSDVQECFPIKDKTISAETKENLAIKGAHTVSSQVIPDKSEEHLKMVNEPAVVTDDCVIDFRLHFVHEKTQPKVASGDNVKVASQSNDEMETGRNVKKDVLPCTSALSDLNNSPRSSDKQNSENKSSLKEGARGIRSGDSKLNSQNLVKCSKKMVAASSHTENKNMSLAESSTERSETFPSNKRVKKRDLVLDANTKMVMKTPQEKSLKPQAPFQDRSKNSITNKMMLMKTPETKNVFTKSGSIFQDKSFITNKMTLMKTSKKMNLFTKQGSIFQDNGVEDEVGDNERTVTSDASTHDSSDSSSESGDSEEESEMSHNLNGSDDVKGISDSGMLEMSKILRNSEQFKKAKLIASQIESEPDELNLNSQPDS